MKKIIKLEENEVVTIEGNQIIITKENTTTENSDVEKELDQEMSYSDWLKNHSKKELI